MAADTRTEPGTADPDRRRSPLAKHVPLWIGFLVVVAIGVVTVLLPEISDDGDDEEEDTAGATDLEDDGDEDEAGAGARAPAAAPPAAAPAP